MIRFSTEHLRTVFADEDKYKNFKKLTYDLNHGNDIYEYDKEVVEERYKDMGRQAIVIY